MSQFIKHFAILAIIFSSIRAQKENSLNGKHLRVIAMEFPVSLVVKRNTSGHIVGFDGVLSLQIAVLSRMFNFSYSYLPTSVTTIEDSLTSRGGISYLINDEADLFLSTTIATPSRFKYADFPASFFSGPFGLIVPYPKEMLNLKGSLKPFSYQVWITIIVAILITILYLRILSCKWIERWQCNKPVSVSSKNKDKTRAIFNFVLGNLVSQGQSFYSNRLVYRIGAGAWCCACFFLVQIYCSTLSSHLISPNRKPIINSLEELANSPDVDLTIDKGLGIDILLKIIEGGIFHRLAVKIKKNPKLLCNTTENCLETVRSGHAAYGAPVNSLKLIMDKDVKRNGTCNYYSLKELFLSSNVFISLPKNSPYTENISIGILRSAQFGLHDVWLRWNVPQPRKCMELQRPRNIPRLSISHLTSAFFILLVGFTVSISMFVLEKMTNLVRLLRKR